ncbi:hypothetical protein SH449x_004128 [Pirellulaceae bacterium SH449]
MATRRCCCGGCEIGRDEFNRADAPTLGAKWEDYDNAWTIDNQTALSVADGVARFVITHPVPDESMVVYCETVNEVENSGVAYRVLVNLKDGGNYHFAEFIRLGANNSILSIGRVSGGVETVYQSEPIVGLTNTSRKIVVKFAAKEMCATVTNCVLSIVTDDPDVINGGYWSGIESTNDDSITMDNFVFEQHRSTKEECDSCLCKCEGNYIPPVLNASLTGTGRMSGLSADIELRWNRVNGRWESGTEFHCNTTWQLIFNCPSDEEDGGTASLVIQLGCTNSDGLGISARVPSSHSCSSTTWTFGAYYVSSLDFACGCGFDFTNDGTYTIIISPI